MSRSVTVLDRLRAVLVLVGAVSQMVLGYLPDLLGWENSIAQRSAEARTPLVPAGWAFAIWAPLFLGSIAFAVYHALPSQLRDPLMRKIGWLVAAAFAGNSAWSLYTPINGLDWTGFILLEMILVSLLLAVLVIRRAGRLSVGRTVALAPIYGLAGWISIASPVAISQVAAFTGWNPLGLSAATSAYLTLAVGAALAFGFSLVARSWVYTGAIAWGLFGVFMINRPQGMDALAYTALALAALVLVAAFIGKRIGGAEPNPAA